MATDVQTLEQATADFEEELNDVCNEGWPGAGRDGRFQDWQVDLLDDIYCRVEAACDLMRQALVARQTGRD